MILGVHKLLNFVVQASQPEFLQPTLPMCLVQDLLITKIWYMYVFQLKFTQFSEKSCFDMHARKGDFWKVEILKQMGFASIISSSNTCQITYFCHKFLWTILIDQVKHGAVPRPFKATRGCYLSWRDEHSWHNQPRMKLYEAFQLEWFAQGSSSIDVQPQFDQIHPCWNASMYAFLAAWWRLGRLTDLPSLFCL